MKLKNNLYTVTQYEQSAEGADFMLQLHKECFIYAAHFPEMPVTPGVCLLLMAKELLEEVVEQGLSLVEVKNAKFLAVVNPTIDQQLMCSLRKLSTDAETSFVQVQATLKTATEVKAKLSIVCQKA